MIAIIQRGTKRDFVDMYFLARKFGLKEIFRIARKKYPGFNEYLAVQSLTYFEDAETEAVDSSIVLYKQFDWGDAKKFFINEAERMLKTWRQDK